ncbi:MAG TPA: dual specificity protein phosphatase family protein [Verrucomicrobiae bacterium]|nr:dual specificity protein phosphatase family protein [Verrucomicrobiae bacterium]
MQSAFPHLWWAIDGVLAGTPMPYVALDRRMNQGGLLGDYEDELPLLNQAGIKAFVCLLNLPGDAIVFESAGFEFLCTPVANGCPPSKEQVKQIVAFIDECRARKWPVAVFCEAGLGRTGTVIAAYLINSGMSACDAIRYVRSKEPSAVETSMQIEFLEELKGPQL